MSKWEYLTMEIQQDVMTIPPTLIVTEVAADGAVESRGFPPVYSDDDIMPVALDALGEQGWELMGTGNLETNSEIGRMLLFFKRPKP